MVNDNKVSNLKKIEVVEEVLSYPHCLRAFRSVESMVMNNKESLAFGDRNMIRHNEVEILEGIKQRRSLSTNILTHTCSPACSQQAKVRSAHCPLA